MKSITITYRDLVNRYGSTMAFGLLLTIEKTAKVNDNLMTLDEEARLSKALEALDNKS